jgi:hypothetical protein
VVPNKTKLRQYLIKGLTQQEIVDAWERESNYRVSRSAISMAIERYGLKEYARTRPNYSDMLPWTVSVEHRHHIDARMLRLEGRRRAGGELHPDEQRWLDAWKRELEEKDAVVHYERNHPDGFIWVSRSDPEVVAAEDDLIDRSNAEKSGGSSQHTAKLQKRED